MVEHLQMEVVMATMAYLVNANVRLELHELSKMYQFKNGNMFNCKGFSSLCISNWSLAITAPLKQVQLFF